VLELDGSDLSYIMIVILRLHEVTYLYVESVVVFVCVCVCVSVCLCVSIRSLNSRFYHLSHISSPFCFKLYFRHCLIFALVCFGAWSSYFASHIAGITGMNHHAWLVCWFFFRGLGIWSVWHMICILRVMFVF
jgi:hypothetical protein